MDRVPLVNRLSLRAVLVSEGEDPGPALAEAGIIDSVALTVFVGEEIDLSGGILGDGRTPNLIAVLETEQEDPFEASPGAQHDTARSASDDAQPSGPATSMLPAAFGLQPLAPVRKIGG